jgi:hypothetical protein
LRVEEHEATNMLMIKAKNTMPMRGINFPIFIVLKLACQNYTIIFIGALVDLEWSRSIMIFQTSS